jgi:cholesterol transport system auxiliary component
MRKVASRAWLFGLALTLAACGGSTRVAYDLSAATPASAAGPRLTLRIREPVPGPNLDSDRILVRDGDTVAVLAGGAWADRLPLLVQARLLQTFQNGRGLRAVGEGAGDYSADLQTELRAFELDAARRVVRIDIVAKVTTPGGHVLAARIFRAEAPVASTEPAVVTEALDGALRGVLRDIVAFASR